MIHKFTGIFLLVLSTLGCWCCTMDLPDVADPYSCAENREIAIDDTSDVLVLRAWLKDTTRIDSIKWVVKKNGIIYAKDSFPVYSDFIVQLQSNDVSAFFTFEATIIDNCKKKVNDDEDYTVQSTYATKLSKYIDSASVKIDTSLYTLGQGGISQDGTPGIAKFSKFYPRYIPPFNLSKYEVTQELWNYVMNIPVSTDYCHTCPKDNISQAEIDDFLTKLNKLTNNKYPYRLPTESEWECAATNKGKNNFNYAGSSEIDFVGWHKKNSEEQIHPVGQKRANGLGIHDLSGNVSEVCIADAIGYYTYLLNNKVTRGGSYEDDFKQNPASSFNYSYISNWNEGILVKKIYNYHTIFDSGGWDGTAKKGVGFRLVFVK